VTIVPRRHQPAERQRTWRCTWRVGGATRELLQVLLENGASTNIPTKNAKSRWPKSASFNLQGKIPHAAAVDSRTDATQRQQSRRSLILITCLSGQPGEPEGCYLLEWMDEKRGLREIRLVSAHTLCLQRRRLHAASTSPPASATALAALLIRHGANANARRPTRAATPLHPPASAPRPGRSPEQEPIPTDLSCLEPSGTDVLYYYVTLVVRFLLECNAKLNKKDHYGNTPLIHACLCGNQETVTTLLQSNALVNVANLQGNTALHEAVRGGHQALVELLLRGGASAGLRNKRQRTPLDCAYELGGKVGQETGEVGACRVM
ncbi:ankyrin repeat domain-containing protein 27-like protein, partial [Lates japonicus]